MAEAAQSRKKNILDEKIEQFCEKSAELLTSIHDRCGNVGQGGKAKKAKRKKKKKEE
jgi:hypothetical protein